MNQKTPSWLEEAAPSSSEYAVHRAVSLFSGCGGFCEGIEKAGLWVNCAVELDPHACATYRFNFPNVPLFEGDIRKFLCSNEDRERFSLSAVDLVFGGPPCQGFSQIGPRRLDDQRNTLYREYLRVVKALRPRVFLMENVPNIVLLNRGHFRDLIFEAFRDIGYSNVTYVKVCASDYGVPQDRNRIIFLGTRDEDRFPDDLGSFSEAILDSMRVAKPFSVWDAIGDLPEEVVPSGESMAYPKARSYTVFQKLMRLDFDHGIYPVQVKRRRGIGEGPLVLHNHHTKEIQERRRELISYLRPGCKGDSLPKNIWNGLRPEKWRRLHPDRPAYTILAQMHRDLSEWVHPKLERWITVREAARLQSFHDGFIFVGSEWQQLKQIGNAVPPILGAALGRLARAVIDRAGGRLPSADRHIPVQASLVLREKPWKKEDKYCRTFSQKKSGRK